VSIAGRIDAKLRIEVMHGPLPPVKALMLNVEQPLSDGPPEEWLPSSKPRLFAIPTGFVVKKGSNALATTSGCMPELVSETPIMA